MKVEFPDYYNNFMCIASKCSDNCCIGWEIDIDEDSYKAYTELDGAFGKRLRESIEGEPPHFKLCGERCPFLNENNLCDIILELGESAICEICTNHPRYYTTHENYTACGVGLCCEEAVRLVLSDKPVSFVINEDETTELSERCRWLIDMKNRAIACVQNRSISMKERLLSVLIFAEKVQEKLDAEDFCTIDLQNGAICHNAESAAERDLIKLHLELETLDPDWKIRLEELLCNLDLRLARMREFEENFSDLEILCEQIGVYFLHRYWMESGNDGDVLGKVHLMLCAVIILRLLFLGLWCEGKLCREEIARLVKAYSKEVEYSEDNLEKIFDASIESDLFKTENLVNAILR